MKMTLHEEPFTITPKELADAIRKNGVKQAIRAFTRWQGGRIYAACALGQAAMNLGLPTHTQYSIDSLIYRSFKLVRRICPAKHCNYYHDGFSYSPTGIQVNSMIMHLNDEHRWKLSRIADWVENTVENK